MTDEEKRVDEALVKCKEIMQEVGCDFMLAGFPKKDGSTQITRAHISTENTAALLDSVAIHLAGKMGISRERVLTTLVKTGTFETSSEDLH